MADLGSGMLIVGALTTLAGIGGFIDTRKVDRRFRTGYKNNAPDNRNFARSGKVLLCGIGICVIGSAINSRFDSSDTSGSSNPVQTQVAPASDAVPAMASDAGASAPIVVKLDPNAAQDAQQYSSAVPSNERVLNSDATPADGGNTQQSSQDSAVSPDTASASPSQTFATSFDCKRASHDDEVAICGDAGLAAMDRQLGQLYSTTMKTISDPQALRQSESDWVITRRMCNSDVDCLRHAYGARIGQFLGSLGSKPLLATDSSSDQQ
ncbi:hypothetical protein [Burkholderia sp. Ax-1719]|uniref:lysozyme inhibitor LprI family protein n=1 Tax=Burkholderia sp. Ax-1719 TaxID=2608334 RepID=UPI00141E725A|nr:hypothetical protein [Burkholderia sp. Ax-1719]NIE63176.1 hypothetical protein [Burkholderia sp. Ax-1719]